MRHSLAILRVKNRKRTFLIKLLVVVGFFFGDDFNRQLAPAEVKKLQKKKEGGKEDHKINVISTI